jgi:hypothetical protein
VEGGDWVLGVGADGYAVYIVVGKREVRNNRCYHPQCDVMCRSKEITLDTSSMPDENQNSLVGAMNLKTSRWYEVYAVPTMRIVEFYGIAGSRRSLRRHLRKYFLAMI